MTNGLGSFYYYLRRFETPQDKYVIKDSMYDMVRPISDLITYDCYCIVHIPSVVSWLRLATHHNLKVYIPWRDIFHSCRKTNSLCSGVCIRQLGLGSDRYDHRHVFRVKCMSVGHHSTYCYRAYLWMERKVLWAISIYKALLLHTQNVTDVV